MISTAQTVRKLLEYLLVAKPWPPSNLTERGVDKPSRPNTGWAMKPGGELPLLSIARTKERTKEREREREKERGRELQLPWKVSEGCTSDGVGVKFCEDLDQLKKF